MIDASLLCTSALAVLQPAPGLHTPPPSPLAPGVNQAPCPPALSLPSQPEGAAPVLKGEAGRSEDMVSLFEMTLRYMVEKSLYA